MIKILSRISIPPEPRIWLSLILLLLAPHGLAASDSAPIDPYDRDTAYIGGLSRQLFSGDRNDITIATEMFFKEITKRIGHDHMEFVIHENTSSILEAMQADRLDTVFSNPIDYLDLDPQINPDHRYTLSYAAHPEQRVYLLTDSVDSVTKLSQLKGKRISIPRGYILGRMFLEIQLAQAGLPVPADFFSGIRRPTSSHAAILDLFFNKADMAVTSDIAFSLASELNPQLSKRVHIFDLSNPFIPFVIGVNKNVPERLLNQVDNILLNIDNEPRLKHILSLFSANEVVKINDAQLQSLRQLKQQHELLIGKD